MDASAKFSLLCYCGAQVKFTDATRGHVIACQCGRLYRIPHRANGFKRTIGRMKWALRWLISWSPRASSDNSMVPYREGAPAAACPRCAAVPTGDPVWQCEFCHCVWNTFKTGGRCPGCGFAYPATYCLACKATSRHSDWYRAAPRLP